MFNEECWNEFSKSKKRNKSTYEYYTYISINHTVVIVYPMWQAHNWAREKAKYYLDSKKPASRAEFNEEACLLKDYQGCWDNASNYINIEAGESYSKTIFKSLTKEEIKTSH